ncbi:MULTISPECIES: hypothetical protein [Pseudomonas]|uniref:Uncharacterized protein n=1 Tax=Pseudomonas nitroreducens TaxID=46680 RepID=A0A6G6J8D8_PSENT|nr:MULTISPECIES: hypothetical protein [Pseudomonas]MDU4254039.1 hypothetical protein [Pseudomonas sp.]QIE91599.1 hypothetical protein G5B91_35310 [Pseudomonas nitroreducens]
MNDPFFKSRVFNGRSYGEPSDLLKRAKEVFHRAEGALISSLGTRHESNAKAALVEAEKALIDATRASASIERSKEDAKFIYESLPIEVEAEDSIAMAKAFLNEIAGQPPF